MCFKWGGTQIQIQLEVTRMTVGCRDFFIYPEGTWVGMTPRLGSGGTIDWDTYM